MTDRLLLDTHIVLWLDSGDNRLREGTRALIDDCWRNGGAVLMSAVTAWEIALLVDAMRIDLDWTSGSTAFSRTPASKRRRLDIALRAAAIGSIISSIATRPTGS